MEYATVMKTVPSTLTAALTMPITVQRVPSTPARACVAFSRLCQFQEEATAGALMMAVTVCAPTSLLNVCPCICKPVWMQGHRGQH